ncbi:hypothetical protein ACA910_009822 [Epithemia clementina (nom. ined.)]
MSQNNNQTPEQPKLEESLTWANDWMFGSSSDEHHHFVERLKERIPKEVGCAFTASFLVSPLVSIIDKCIVQDISGSAQFMKAIGTATKEMIFTPTVFLNSLAFKMTFAVYFGTYAVANLSEAVMDAKKVRGDKNRKQYKVAAASAANIGLLAWRDSVFARVLSKNTGAGPKPATPLRTIGLFAARDGATMYSTFYLAPRAADYLHKQHGVERNVAALSMALAIPMTTQVITAPLHIYAMDYYNNRTATTAERMAVLKKEFPTVSFARSLRILPAFGIGSFSNNKFREWFIRQTDEELLLARRLTRFITKRSTQQV